MTENDQSPPALTTIFERSCDAIRDACTLIAEGKTDVAKSCIADRYPFTPFRKSKRSYTPKQFTAVCVRDGFIDRYRGNRVIYPPSLRLLSHYLKEEFPYHKNAKMSVAHIAYWELLASIDHVSPVARAGDDKEDNWVCCSMLTNSMKGNWTLEQLGWVLRPSGSLRDWDGLLPWFVERIEEDQSLLTEPYFKLWYNAARVVASHSLTANRLDMGLQPSGINEMSGSDVQG